MEKLLLPLLILVSILMSACGNDREPELVFVMADNSSPENIQFFFTSHDPRCLPREGMVYTKQFAGQLTMKCTNSTSLALRMSTQDDASQDTYRSERGKWSVRLVDNTTLVLDFEAIDPEDVTTLDIFDMLYVSGAVDGKAITSAITVRRIIDPQYLPKPDVPDKEVNTEADIVYQEFCPFDKYAIEPLYFINGKGEIFYEDGDRLPGYDAARIYIEDVLDKADPNWTKFESVPYMAIYSYVISPLADKINLVRNGSDGPMFKYVVPEDEFRYIIETMKPGEELHYTLILANVHKLGLQKLTFTIRRR